MTKKLLGPTFALAVGALVGAANAPAVQADADSFTYTTDDGNGGGDFSVATDMVIELTGDLTLDRSDFIF